MQLKALQEGVDIVIGTPGRLDDLITTGKLDLSGVSAITPYKGSVITCCSLQQVSFFVLDEAVSPSTHLHTHTHTHTYEGHFTLRMDFSHKAVKTSSPRCTISFQRSPQRVGEFR